MSIITLRCPDCKKDLQLQSALGIEAKTANCPHCQKPHKICELLPKLSFMVNNNSYQLHLGKQWVGRQSPNSTAEVQIPDSTCYMSKQHAIVTITITANGYKVTFEEHGKNPTSLQNVPLIADDIVWLNVGDCLVLGGQQMYLANEFGEQ